MSVFLSGFSSSRSYQGTLREMLWQQNSKLSSCQMHKNLNYLSCFLMADFPSRNIILKTRLPLGICQFTQNAKVFFSLRENQNEVFWLYYDEAVL